MFCGAVCLSGSGAALEPAIARGLNSMTVGRPWRHDIRVAGPAAFGGAWPRAAGPGGSSLLARDGLLIVCDAELHERDRLRDELGARLPPGAAVSDAALLLAAYRAWGTGCAGRLLGEFAFAIWDSEAGRLYCASDHVRRRVLYRHVDGDRIAFASEPRALFAFPWVDRKLNDLAMAEFLATSLYTVGQGTTTFYQGVEHLPGASWLSFGVDGVRAAEYWSPESVTETTLDAQACIAEYRTRLERAVHRRMESGRQFGIMLSGGFDSTAVACIAARRLAQTGRRLIAVTAVAPGTGTVGERDARYYAERVRDHLPNLDLHLVSFDAQDIVAPSAQEFAILDRPIGGFERRFGALAARAADLGVDVLLTGFGGDQAATSRGHGFSADMFLRGHWRRLARECTGRARTKRVPVWRIVLEDVVIPLLPEALWRRYRTFRNGGGDIVYAEGTCLPAFAVAAGAEQRLARKPLGAWRRRTSVRANSCAGIRHVMEGTFMTPMDRLALARGVRLSHPLFDRDVLEFGLSLPAHLHVGDGQRRFMMRRAGAGLLPPAVLARPDGNDSSIPDFLARMIAARPAMLQGIDELERDDHVSTRVDLDKLRAIIAGYSNPDPRIRGGQLAQYALRGYSAAHFIQWFERRNR